MSRIQAIHSWHRTFDRGQMMEPKHSSKRVPAIAATTITGLTILLSGCKNPNDNACIKAMSFNIRYDNPADAENRWENRFDLVARTILLHQADVVGIQEALHNQLIDLTGLLPEFEWIGVGRDDGKTQGEYAPIFYKPDRFKREDWGSFWLSETPDVPGSRGWDAACNRIVTWVRLYDRINRLTLFVFNTHFDHVGQQARKESARLLTSRIRSIARGTPFILTGDFNCAETDSAYIFLIQGFGNASDLQDTYQSANIRYGSSSTYNGFEDIPQYRERIDFIFADRGWTVDAQGILAERWDGRFVSDHYPVIAFLRRSKDRRGLGMEK